MFKPVAALLAFIRYRHEKTEERAERDRSMAPALKVRDELLNKEYLEQTKKKSAFMPPFSTVSPENADTNLASYQASLFRAAEEALNESHDATWESTNQAITRDWKHYYIAEDFALENTVNVMRRCGMGMVGDGIKKVEGVITDLQCLFDENRSMGRTQAMQIRHANTAVSPN